MKCFSNFFRLSTNRLNRSQLSVTQAQDFLCYNVHFLEEFFVDKNLFQLLIIQNFLPRKFYQNTKRRNWADTEGGLAMHEKLS